MEPIQLYYAKVRGRSTLGHTAHLVRDNPPIREVVSAMENENVTSICGKRPSIHSSWDIIDKVSVVYICKRCEDRSRTETYILP